MASEDIHWSVKDGYRHGGILTVLVGAIGLAYLVPLIAYLPPEDHLRGAHWIGSWFLLFSSGFVVLRVLMMWTKKSWTAWLALAWTLLTSVQLLLGGAFLPAALLAAFLGSYLWLHVQAVRRASVMYECSPG